MRLEIKGIFVYLSLNFLDSLNTKVKCANSNRFRIITIIEVDTVERSQNWWFRSHEFAQFGRLGL